MNASSVWCYETDLDHAARFRQRHPTGSCHSWWNCSGRSWSYEQQHRQRSTAASGSGYMSDQATGSISQLLVLPCRESPQLSTNRCAGRYCEQGAEVRVSMRPMRKSKHTKLRLATKSELLEQARLAVEDSRQLLRDTKKVIAENERLRRQLRKLLRDSN